MIKIKLIIFVLFVVKVGYAQTSTTKFYSNQWLNQEVSERKALFSATVTKNADESITTDIKDLKRNLIIRSETYKGAEPFGIWKYYASRSADYNFQMKYGQTKDRCSEIQGVKITNFFLDNDSLGYKAPKIATGESNLSQFFYKHLVYPQQAIEKEIKGTVYVVFKITEEGKTDDIFVSNGINILLDKEAVRIIRKLKFSNPPTLKGKVLEHCFKVPVQFRLED